MSGVGDMRGGRRRRRRVECLGRFGRGVRRMRGTRSSRRSFRGSRRSGLRVNRRTPSSGHWKATGFSNSIRSNLPQRGKMVRSRSSTSRSRNFSQGSEQTTAEVHITELTCISIFPSYSYIRQEQNRIRQTPSHLISSQPCTFLPGTIVESVLC